MATTKLIADAESTRHKVESFKWGESSALDAFESLMWRLDRYPNLRSAVTAVELLDGVPDRARVRDAHVYGTRSIHRLRQRLIDTPAGILEWVEDSDFDVDAHLSFVSLDPPGDLRQLLNLAQDFAMQPFDRDLSPWAALIVDGLEGGLSAYILKLHHAMSDGIGIVQLLSFLHSRQREPRGSRDDQQEAPKPTVGPTRAAIAWRQVRRGLYKTPGYLGGTLAEVRSALRPVEPEESVVSRLARYAASARRVFAPALAAPSPLFAQRDHQWRFEAFDISLLALKSAAKACGATLNDAFVSGLLGAFRRYHQHFGVELDELPISFPISIRREDDAAGGNRFAPGQFAGPIGEPDPARRMRQIGEQVLRIRDEPALAAPLALMPLLVRLPTPLVARTMAAKLSASDLQISNVPGIRDAVFFAGARVTHLYPYAPLPGCPAMISLVSHGTTCCVGLNLDRAAITEPDRLMKFMGESFAEILALG